MIVRFDVSGRTAAEVREAAADTLATFLGRAVPVDEPGLTVEAEPMVEAQQGDVALWKGEVRWEGR